MKNFGMKIGKVMKNKKVKFALKALVSGVLFLWVVSKVDWVSAWGYVVEIKLRFLLLYVLLLFLGISISSYKWSILTRYKGFKKSFRWHFQTYLAGTFVNNFLPSTIGGDTYRALELGANAEGKHSPGVSTIFFDRLTGLWSLAFLGCLFSLIEFKVMIEHPLWVGVVVGMGVFLIVDVALTLDRRGFFVRMMRPFPEMIVNLAIETSGFRDKEVVRKSISLAMFFTLIGVGLANYVLFYALGLHVGVLKFLSVIFVINAIAAIPVSVNNIGIKEWAYFVFFGYLGLSTDIAVTVAIVSRFVQMLISFLALPGYIEGKRK